MTSAEMYRLRAAECRQQAKEAFSAADSDSWLRIADDWMTLARACAEPDENASAAIFRFRVFRRGT